MMWYVIMLKVHMFCREGGGEVCFATNSKYTWYSRINCRALSMHAFIFMYQINVWMEWRQNTMREYWIVKLDAQCLAGESQLRNFYGS